VLRIAGRNTSIPYNLTIEKACTPSVEDIVAGVLSVV
jgi:pyruvate/2-oxoglutarate/acetoin dehydrogenase E1 component